MRPRVFVGSASLQDRMDITRAVARRLEKDFKVIPHVWPHIFSPGENTLSSLIQEAERADFAIFVMGPDDRIFKSRDPGQEGKTYSTTRDNVVFEMGLFIGTLGMNRCFAILPDNCKDLHIFTDFLGENYLTYILTNEPGIAPIDAVHGACYEIGQKVKELGAREKNEFRMLFGTRSQAVVVYPHIVTTELTTKIHESMNESDVATYEWMNREQDVAHFDDLRAVNSIAELCGRMQVNVIASRDGLEQGEIQSLNTISFSIGLRNGYTSQAFKIICDETKGRIRREGGQEEDKPTRFYVDGQCYPPEAETGPSGQGAGRHETSVDGAVCETAMASRNNHAIIIRSFASDGSGRFVPRFVCGGCQADGTAATGVYLKKHWRDLLDFYERLEKSIDKHGLAAVLRFSGGKVESSEPKPVRLCFFADGAFESYEPSGGIDKGWRQVSSTAPVAAQAPSRQRPPERLGRTAPASPVADAGNEGAPAPTARRGRRGGRKTRER